MNDAREIARIVPIAFQRCGEACKPQGLPILSCSNPSTESWRIPGFDRIRSYYAVATVSQGDSYSLRALEVNKFVVIV